MWCWISRKKGFSGRIGCLIHAWCQLAEMVRISSNYAGMLRAQEVRHAACDGIIWVRVERRENSMNLVFPPRGESALAG